MVTNDGLSGWWVSSGSGNVETGGQIDLTFSGLAVLSFRCDELRSNRLLRLKCVSGPIPWEGSVLLFELEQSDEQVFLTLTHENDDASEDEFLYFSTKWPVYLLSLKGLVETGKGRPYPHDIKIHVGD